MQIRIVDVERMNCNEEAKKEEEAIIDVSPPLYYFVLDRNIYRKKKKTNKENNLVNDVVCPIDISHGWKTKCRIPFWNV